MKTSEEFNRAVDLIERSIVAEEQEDAYSLWKEAIASAVLAKNHNKEDAESNYLVGYVFYKCPRKTKEIWGNAEIFLSRAIELSSDHQLARYYLACAFYDQKKYSAALMQLSNISEDFFNGIGQSWRIGKTNELRLCCNLYLGNNAGAFNQAKGLLALYKAFDDVLLAPLPTEFAKCLECLLECQNTAGGQIEGLCQICYEIFELLRASDMVGDRWPLVHKGKGVSPKQ